MTNGKPKQQRWDVIENCILLPVGIILLEVAIGLGYLILWAIRNGWPT